MHVKQGFSGDSVQSHERICPKRNQLLSGFTVVSEVNTGVSRSCPLPQRVREMQSRPWQKKKTNKQNKWVNI